MAIPVIRAICSNLLKAGPSKQRNIVSIVRRKQSITNNSVPAEKLFCQPTLESAGRIEAKCRKIEVKNL